MDIRTAKRLASGSTFWSPSKNTHDVSGYRLQVIVRKTDGGFLTIDEHGYVSTWFFTPDRNLIAACKIAQPIGATEPDKIIEYFRKTGRL